MDWSGLFLIFVLVVFLAPILAVIALARAGSVERKAEALQREVDRLKLRLELVETPQQRPQPQARAEAARPVERIVEPAPAQRAPVTPPEIKAPEAAAEPAGAAAIEPPPAPEPVQATWARASASFERMVAANWLVWLGAAALALGGIFLVRFAWEQGYFGPEARTIAATVAGLAMIVASEWLRRRIPAEATGQIGLAPLLVAAAGSVTLYGAAYAAGPLYQLVPPQLTLAGFVAASAVAVALAVRHGAFLAALGLTGGFIAPLLVGGGEPDPVMLLAYAFAVTLAGLVLVRAFDWRRIAWVALLGAGLWMALGVAMIGRDTGPVAVVGYALALLLAATVMAWSDADAFFLRGEAKPGELAVSPPAQTVGAAHGFWIIAGLGLLAAFSAANAGQRDPAMVALGVYGVAAVVVGWRKAAFQLMPLLGAAAFLAGLWLAPVDTAERYVVAEGIALQPFDDPAALTYRFLAFAWAGAIAMGVGGWMAMRTMQSGRTLMAAVSAFAPLGLLIIAFDKLGEAQQHFSWGLAGGVVALLNLAALEGLRRAAGGLDAAKGAASAYALGAFAASMFGVGASLGEMWMTALFALHLPALAIIDRRFNLPALRLCASIAAMVVAARLLSPPEILSYTISATPLLNELTLLYGLPLICFWVAARLFAINLKSADAPLVQALDIGAIVLLTALAAVTVRHIATGGNLAASDADLIEISAYTLAFTGLALGLAVRLGPQPRTGPGMAALAVYWLAVVLAVLGLGLLFNPLMRAWEEAYSLNGPPLLNLLAASYLPPAALFGVHAIVMRRQGRVLSGHFSGFISLGLAFLYVTLEVRNAFQDTLALHLEPVGETESYTYSIVWLLFAVATLIAGLVRRQVAIRHAAMAVLALSVAKVFILDMSALTGVLRAASFMGLGVALITIAYLYQRLVFRRAEA